jgi:hypothetical protein
LTRLIDADRLLALLRQKYPTEAAGHKTVRLAIEELLARKHAVDSWRNPGWEEREKESK